jgi:hypothetical protein
MEKYMTIADSSQFRLAHIAESTAGTTPSTPTLLVDRVTGGGMQTIQDYITSNEIRSDRQVTDRVRVGRRSEGTYNFELSYGSFDDWMESLFQSTWSTNVLENGVTRKYFTFEETFECGATDQYKRFTGVQVNDMSLSISANSIVTGSFGLMGFGTPSLAQAAIASSTYTAANTNPVLSASNDFASFAMTSVTSPKIQALNLNITNNLRNQPVVGDIDPVGQGSGRFEVTGSITMYFENNEAYDLFLANTYTDLSFSVGGASTLKYDVSIPNIKFTSASIEAAGNDTDVPITLDFGAVRDASQDHTIEITRTPA